MVGGGFEQTVEEVKSSFGVKVKDMNDIRERLKRQGLDTCKIDTRGGVNDGQVGDKRD